MNWRFGYSLGRTEVDGFIYAGASAAADALKALVPFFFFAAVRNRMWSHAAAAAVVGAVVTAYSLAAALGHAALNRNATAGHRLVEIQAYKAVSDDLKRAQDQLSWIAPHRPPAAVRAEIAGLKAERLWTATQSCTAVTGKISRDYCQKYQTLVVELESGQQAEALGLRIRDAQTKLEGMNGAAASGGADPQAAVLAELLGLDVARVQFRLVVFVAILLEVGSGLGMYMAMSLWQGRSGNPDDRGAAPDIVVGPVVTVPIALPPPAQTDEGGARRNSVAQFCQEQVDRAGRDAFTATALYEAYRTWCESRGVRPLTMPAFVRQIDSLGLEKVRQRRRTRYVGIGLKTAAVAESGQRLN
ncbi:MAG: hypothetical protein EBS23_00795 [Betaproteobacteria bacterium]|nr:hypothetical protein [Betaproteobacteria bacterium]